MEKNNKDFRTATYRGADKSLARPGKGTTALYSHLAEITVVYIIYKYSRDRQTIKDKIQGV
jgi:hypothetical protein